MSVALAVKGLAVLTAIPVVILALWADYFVRAVEALAKADPLLDRAAELSKPRMAGLAATFFQFGIFMGTGNVREHAPLPAIAIFVLALLLQGGILAAVERKVRKPEQPHDALVRKPVQELELATRAFTWATVGGAIYLMSFATPVLLATAVIRHFSLSGGTATTLMLFGAVAGMLAGLGFNFALGATYLRKVLPAREVVNEKLQAMLEKCFASGGVPSPSFWIVDTGRAREATAVMAGFTNGKKWFRPGLFLSQSLIQALSDEELRAVVLHEVSHLQLKHLRRRLFYSVALVVGSTAVATFALFLSMLAFPGSELRSWIGFAAAAGAFIFTFRLLAKQSRAHETEADVHSIRALGSEVRDLASALRKLDEINFADSKVTQAVSMLGGSGHPETERRIAHLETTFGVKVGELSTKEAA